MARKQQRKYAAWRLPSPKSDILYSLIWKEVDEAARQTFLDHPEYLTEAGRQAAHYSLCKRLTGKLTYVVKKLPDDRP